MEFETLKYELEDEGSIARIIMNRPEARNAQDNRMTYELNDAFTAAALDDTVKVIILSGEGPHFSSGHDIRGGQPFADGHTPTQVFPYSATLPGRHGGRPGSAGGTGGA